MRSTVGIPVCLRPGGCQVVNTDPAEAECWAYEAGKEAWEFDLRVPEKLASYPALSAAFKRGFDSVEQASSLQGAHQQLAQSRF